MIQKEHVYLTSRQRNHPESVHTLDNDVPSIADAFTHVALSHLLEPVCDNLTSATQSQSLQITSSTKPVNTSAVLVSEPHTSVTALQDACGHIPKNLIEQTETKVTYISNLHTC